MLARIFAAAIAVVFLSAATVADPMPAPLSAVVEIDKNCTGFHIGGGRVVTAGHCIDKFSGFSVVTEDGVSHAAMLAMFSNPFWADDIAIIQVADLGGVAALPLDCGSAPSPGTDVHMTGYPAVYGLSTVWGKVAGAPRDYSPIGGWREAIPINIASYGGFSGSPVMTGDGEVVGILVGSIRDAHTLAMAVPAYRLCEVIGDKWVP